MTIGFVNSFFFCGFFFFFRPTLLCLVQLCSSRSDRGGRYALFPFPTSHPDVCRQWMSFCSLREDRPLPRTAAVCARHFPPNQLVQAGGGRVHLRLGAVPAHYGPQVYNAHAMLTPPRSLQQQQQQQQGSPLKKSPAQGSVQVREKEMWNYLYVQDKSEWWNFFFSVSGCSNCRRRRLQRELYQVEKW